MNQAGCCAKTLLHTGNTQKHTNERHSILAMQRKRMQSTAKSVSCSAAEALNCWQTGSHEKGSDVDWHAGSQEQGQVPATCREGGSVDSTSGSSSPSCALHKADAHANSVQPCRREARHHDCQLRSAGACSMCPCIRKARQALPVTPHPTNS
jgi:hypothetical protein